MISIRPVVLGCDGRVSPEDHGLVSPWWEARGGVPPTRDMLPGCGALAFLRTRPMACAFMYLDATGSGVAWLSWLASNPRAPVRAAGSAIGILIDFLLRHARSLNYWLVNATYCQPSLIRHLKRGGFRAGDTGMTQLFKALD